MEWILQSLDARRPRLNPLRSSSTKNLTGQAGSIGSWEGEGMEVEKLGKCECGLSHGAKRMAHSGTKKCGNGGHPLKGVVRYLFVESKNS